MWGGDAEQREFAAIWQAWSGAAGARDPSAALPRLIRLAEAGFAPAQHAVGMAYLNGKGTRCDPEVAFRHFLAAAEQDYPEAATAVGTFHAPGAPRQDFCAQDAVRAVQWFRRGAEGGDPVAQVNLALRCRDGSGIEKDAAQAYIWASLAVHCSRTTNRPAEFIRDQAAGELDERQRADADAQVAQSRRRLPLPWSVHAEYWKRLAQQAEVPGAKS